MTNALRVTMLHESGSDRHPIVLLHGFMGTADDWSNIGPELGRRTGRPVAAVDLPGHGASVSLPEGAYSFEGATAGIRDAVFESGLAPAVLVGYSMGGRLAMATACRAPDLVAALVVESGHPGLAEPEARAARLDADRRTAERLVREWPGFLDDWYAQPVFEGTPAGVIRRWTRRRRENDSVELARALVGLSTGRQDPLADRLAAVNRPLLFLAGERDRKYVEIGRSLAAASERTSFFTVEGAGHNVHAERPETYLRSLETFVETCLEPID